MTTATANGRKPRVPALALEPEPIIAANAGTPNLDAAVLRVQAAAGKLIRNAPGQIGTRTYGYVTLDAVTDEVLPLLVAEDLLWKTFPTALDGEPALRYRMTHVPSGEYDEDTMLLLCDRTSQGQGSGDTYARRYSLVAYLNLTIDPDDDGWSANAPTTTAPVDRYAEAEAVHAQPTAAEPRQSERPANAKQRGMLWAKARAAELTSVQFANVVMVAKGEQPRDTDDQDAALRWLKRELDRLPARLVNDVVAGIER